MRIIRNFMSLVKRHEFRFNAGFLLGGILFALHRSNVLWAIFREIPYTMSILALKFGFRTEPRLEQYHKLNHDEVFLDIGANEGFYAIILSDKCKNVFAWEPDPLAFERLLYNTSRLNNATCFNEALGESDKSLPFNLHHSTGLGSFIYKGLKKGVVEVRVRPLDSYSFSDKVGLIKIDTQGYEIPVIKGASRTINDHKPRLIIELHGETKEQFMEQFKQIRKMLPLYNWTTVNHHIIGDVF